MPEVVGYDCQFALVLGQTLWRATHAVRLQSHLHASGLPWLLERYLGNVAGGEAVVQEIGWPVCEQDANTGVGNCLAIQFAETERSCFGPGLASAEAFFAAEIERQIRLQRLPVGREESHHTTEVIVVAVGEQASHRASPGRLLEDRGCC